MGEARPWGKGGVQHGVLSFFGNIIPASTPPEHKRGNDGICFGAAVGGLQGFQAV
ncbi:hypothetical protein HMPREF9123_1378 [Neisseria bacilliformis ATCC BAA-1200]|uniref:Uncharacterized protein n=1 Tax=Neisseria bacilliformis ATCC BAA-1200 TaxID=888742 RepID=F2BCF0_9NEIS|nr:hypothetical protein HMPREF9123_1378 [Neisseria bacilliformis ATCC BAA-1200]